MKQAAKPRGGQIWRQGGLVLALLSAPATALGWAQSTTSADGSGDPLAWTNPCVRWRFNERGSADVGFDDALTALQDSFAEWGAQNCSHANFLYDGTTAVAEAGYVQRGGNVNVMVFLDEPGSWPHEAGVIALATVTFCRAASGGACPEVGTILDSDVEFNGEQFAFSTTDVSLADTFDIANTATHEAGHLLGLDHTDEARATMFPSAPPRERQKRTLHPDDIEGLCAIYPTPEDVADACAGLVPGEEPQPDPPEDEGGCSVRAERPAHSSWWLAALVPLLLGRRRRQSGMQESRKQS